MIAVTWETLPLILLTIAVGALGAARLTRVVVYDEFPPTVWLRERWYGLVEGSGWEKLLTCWWCFAFWAALAVVVSWVFAQQYEWVGWAWWITWGTLALGYVAPMIIVRDGDDG